MERKFHSPNNHDAEILNRSDWWKKIYAGKYNQITAFAIGVCMFLLALCSGYMLWLKWKEKAEWNKKSSWLYNGCRVYIYHRAVWRRGSHHGGICRFVLLALLVIRRRKLGVSVEKIMSFMFLVPSSMLSAVSALCAQNIGAGYIGRAKQTLRYAIICNMCYGICKREKSIWKNGGLNENFRIIFYLPCRRTARRLVSWE